MLKKGIIILFSILVITGCSKEDIEYINYIDVIEGNTSYIGYLVIPSIDMKLGFYDYDSPLNDVSKNIELIDTGIANTYLIAAHSGTGPLAYFNDLKDVLISDDVYLEYKSNILHYQVIDIKRVKKVGSINIPNEENELILTTCDQIVKGYQLIIIAKLVE